MENFKNLILHNKKRIFIGTAAFAVILALALGLNLLGRSEEKAYYYENKIEALLAQRTIDYLDQNVVMKDDDLNEMGNMAVKTYNTILESGAVEITDEHSRAIEAAISDALNLYLKDESLSEADYETLAIGISKIILDVLLTELINSDLAINVNYSEEFNALTSSLQEQIADIEKRMEKLRVNATIRFNTDEIEANINDAISSSLEASKNEIYEEINSNVSGIVEKQITEKEKEMVNNIINEVKDGVTSGKDGKDGATGATGATGAAGTAGKDGKDGEDGEDGSNGKSTYIAYADDDQGNGFSLTPTETSKYIGTCITEVATQPSSVSDYSNWQPYRSYIMTVTTDEYGESTLHIR
ncbi:MAG: hypothetical protein ACI4DN_03395 [Lachnospiraceae bacterium]